jgi:GNAT superfamily N-acetyltransferase
VAWNQHLIAEPEGPSFISRTVERRQYSRRRARDTRPAADFTRKGFPVTFGESQHVRPLLLAGNVMIISLERTAATLPADFPELEADATADGHRHMVRLAAESKLDRAMFHAMYTCRVNGRLAGVGAITDEPAMTAHPMWRMRRLYLHRQFRRREIARTIARALLLEAVNKVSIVTVHAGSDGAAKFWEATGFRPVEDRTWSHEALVLTKS